LSAFLYSESLLQAHLEELTVENARLQQLVDILDSQPELMFCINARGDITYISERTVNFVNITGVDSGSDEEPTHILQILRKDSVDSVLSSIQEIIRVSPPKSALAESSMLFSTKVSF
jgi:PAS domain-containing protein